jgi:hypothetical protein
LKPINSQLPKKQKIPETSLTFNNLYSPDPLFKVKSNSLEALDLDLGNLEKFYEARENRFK